MPFIVRIRTNSGSTPPSTRITTIFCVCVLLKFYHFNNFHIHIRAVAKGVAGAALAAPLFFNSNLLFSACAETLWNTMTCKVRVGYTGATQDQYHVDSMASKLSALTVEVPEKPYQPKYYNFPKRVFGKKETLPEHFNCTGLKFGHSYTTMRRRMLSSVILAWLQQNENCYLPII